MTLKRFIETFLLVFATTFLLLAFWNSQQNFESEVWATHDACTEYSGFGEDHDYYDDPYHNDHREMDMYFECMRGEQ